VTGPRRLDPNGPAPADVFEHIQAPPEVLTIGEVAKAFGVTVGTVSNWDRDGRISSFRTPGGQRRFRRSDVDALLQQTTAS
jgi:excisionase family DNA binding protein